MKTRIRFSLRTLLVLISLFVVICGMQVHQARKQGAARKWVAEQGGHITFAHKYNSRTQSYDRRTELAIPDWLVTVFGIDLFDSVDAVILDNKTVSDLRPLTDLPKLRSLAIFIDIDDELDFSPLAELGNLEEVVLGYTGITDVRLRELQNLLPQVHINEHLPQ
jgi:hypothetical protein